MQIILLEANKWASSRLAAKRFQKEMAHAQHGTILVIPEGVKVIVHEFTGDAMPPAIQVNTEDGEVEFLKVGVDENVPLKESDEA